MDQKTTLHQSAAEYLAHAATDLFPNALLLGGQGTSRYFYYDLQLHFPVEKQTLSLIEERMVRLAKARKEIQKKEMLASNAAQFFAARGQSFLSEKLQTIDGLVSLFSIEDFFDYCPYPFSLNWPEALHIKLFDSQSLSFQGREITRIFGALSSDKSSLKALLKAPLPSAWNLTRYVIDAKLFLPSKEGHWIWQPKGEVLRELLLKSWKNRIFQEKFHIISTINPLSVNVEASLLHGHQDCFAECGYPKLAEIAYFPKKSAMDFREGLLECASGFSDRLTLFCLKENFLQSCISFLHFILEMPRILGFEFQLTLGLSTAKARSQSGKHVLQTALETSGLNYRLENDYRPESEAWIEVQMSDTLGRFWSGPSMSVPTHTQTPTLICSLFGTMERFVGLMLEHYRGVLPLWLAPEQVRLIPLNEEAHCYATQVQQTLENEGIRSGIVKEISNLGSQLYQAIVQKVPFAVIIGDRELQSGSLVVRALESPREERMQLDALCKCIKRELQNSLRDPNSVIAKPISVFAK